MICFHFHAADVAAQLEISKNTNNKDLEGGTQLSGLAKKVTISEKSTIFVLYSRNNIGMTVLLHYVMSSMRAVGLTGEDLFSY